MIVQITGSGAEDVLRELRGMSLDVRDGKRLRATLKRAAQPLVDAMRARVRVKSGELQRSIAARALRTRGWGIVGVLVGPSKALSYRAKFIEYGYVRRNHRTGGISHIPAFPFARPSWDSTQGAVQQEIVTGVRIALDEARRG